jgi:hypothetical protein
MSLHTSTRAVVIAALSATALLPGCDALLGEDGGIDGGSGQRVCRTEIRNGEPQGIFYVDDVEDGFCSTRNVCVAEDVPGNVECRPAAIVNTQLCRDQPDGAEVVEVRTSEGVEVFTRVITECGTGFICAAPGDPDNIDCVNGVTFEQQFVCRDEVVDGRSRGAIYALELENGEVVDERVVRRCEEGFVCVEENVPEFTNCEANFTVEEQTVCRNEIVNGEITGRIYVLTVVDGDIDSERRITDCQPEVRCQSENDPGNPLCALPVIVNTPVCLEEAINGRLQGNIYEGGTNREDITENCPAGFICEQPGNPDNTACMTTVQNEDSEYARYPCSVNRDRVKTTFDMDCRCTLNYGITTPVRMCLRPERLVRDDLTDIEAGAYGRGPHVFEFGQFAELRAGFVNDATREVFIAGRFRAGVDPVRGTGRGFVMAIDLDSGDRRIISGDFSTGDGQLQVRGAGPGFRDAWNVQPGPNGELYVLDYLGTGDANVFRVDPGSGVRTLVWTNEPERVTSTMGVCDHGSTVPSERQRITTPINGGNPSFEVDGAGNIYLALERAGFGTGIGLMKVSNDGRSCTFFSRDGADNDNVYFGEDIGTGPSFGQGSLSALHIVGNTLYATNSINGNTFAVDLATGNRRIVLSGVSGIVHTVVNPHDPDDLWTVGRDTSTIIERNQLSTGLSANYWDFDTFNRGPLAAGTLGSGGFFFDPDEPDIAYFSHDNWSLVKVEISTFNNFVLSL